MGANLLNWGPPQQRSNQSLWRANLNPSRIRLLTLARPNFYFWNSNHHPPSRNLSCLSSKALDQIRLALRESLLRKLDSAASHEFQQSKTINYQTVLWRQLMHVALPPLSSALHRVFAFRSGPGGDRHKHPLITNQQFLSTGSPRQTSPQVPCLEPPSLSWVCALNISALGAIFSESVYAPTSLFSSSSSLFSSAVVVSIANAQCTHLHNCCNFSQTILQVEINLYVVHANIVTATRFGGHHYSALACRHPENCGIYFFFSLWSATSLDSSSFSLFVFDLPSSLLRSLKHCRLVTRVFWVKS